MEIIMAFIVFFGGFTLGTISTEKLEGSTQAITINNNESNDVIIHTPGQPIYINEGSSVHSVRISKYRDLTRPYHGQIDQQDSENDDCDEEDSDE